MAPAKQTAFRLTDEDLAILEQAQKQMGALSKAETLRAVLRFWLDHHPEPAERPKPKRRK